MKSFNFSQFTNQYELSKTLRFELKPVGKTKEMLEESKVFEKDKMIQKKYEQTKPYFDRLHRDFVQESLSNAVLSGLDGYLEIFKEWKKDKKIHEKELLKKEKELRKEVVTFFDSMAKSWVEKYEHINLKKKDVSLLFEVEVFQILEKRYGAEEDTNIINESTGEIISIFGSWKGFTGYFTKFFETRKNFYRDDGTSTALATRIIDQNLKRFCDNLSIFKSIKDKIGLSEVKKNFGKSLEEVFSLDFYNQCLLQDGIDLYNLILGGETKENGEKLKGLNELINKYRQDHKSEKLSYFKLLDKQILSEKDKLITKDEVDETNILDVLSNFQEISEQKIDLLENLIQNFVANNNEYNLNLIYFSREAFNTISHRWTNKTHNFEKLLYEAMKVDKVTGNKYEKASDTYKFPDFIALSYFKIALENSDLEEMFWKDRYYKNEKGVLDGGESIWDQFLKILDYEFKNNFNVFEEKNNAMKEYLEKAVFKNEKEDKIIIKEFADSVLWTYQMGKYFAVEKKRNWIEDYELCDLFYKDPKNGYLKFYENAFEEIVSTYNSLRNFLTKKPWEETQKWKLNFGNSTLADGWDKNKEPDNFAVILRKKDKYYLGLMKKGCNKIFADKNLSEFSQNIEQGSYEKMVYKFFPDQAKMFPKVCFSKKGLEFFQPSEEIYEIYKNEGFKKGDTFSPKSMRKLIDFYKNCLTKYEGWKCYNFKHLKSTKDYKENIGKFFVDVAKDGYKINFVPISESYINEKNQNEELYLFEIYNQDFAKGKTGKKNLHTLYFEGLFSDENLQNGFPIKLNGQAEIFYRPKTDKNKLGKKKDRQGKDVINHKRYAVDKTFFHCPINLNRGTGKPYRYNNEVNNFLANNPDINIIGIDRGEKHLAYYSVITQTVEILDCGSLNFIQNKKSDGTIILKNGKKINEVRNSDGEIIDYELVETGEKVKAEDYKLLLEYKEKKRKIERQTWQTVEGIKDLKKGYISQVVRKLADLAIDNNAIIVFEDLNMRFKQIRGGIEKSIYQQLEKALIEKLNFLVNKGETDPKKAGNLLKAYQLTAPFETFKDMGKQTGIIFYTQASYTSKIDPVTGWRPNWYLKYSSAAKAKTDILKFSDIRFNNEKNRFEFTYDIKKIHEQKEYPKRTVWTLCSCVERWRWNRNLNQNKGGYKPYPNLTDDYKKLFEEYDIEFLNGEDILKQIEIMGSKGNEKFFKSFIFLWSLICQIRNTDDSKEGDENDIILSPVEPFFDSRKSEKFGKSLPKNGDDNGAFNIARKGIVVLDKITDFHAQNGGCEKMTWGDLYVSHTDWDNFSQG